MVPRLLNPLKSDSFFIFGARGTGKSTYILEQFLRPSLTHKNPSTYFKIDLLDSEAEEKYSRRPGILEKEILSFKKPVEWVVIDEVQKVPALLNHVHRLIESKKQKFILTGSSSRKLKRVGANLLAGRAFLNYLHPLTIKELGKSFSLDAVINWGALPKAILTEVIEQRKAYLKSYVQTYIREEIRIEQLVRDLDPFRDFLEVAAQMNGKIINYSKIAREIGSTDKTVRSYFQILCDTYLGFYLRPFHRSIRKAQADSPKFYFFDIGVKKALEKSLDSLLIPSTASYGEAFEHLVILEIMNRFNYQQKDYSFSFFRTKEGNEIDLIISLNRREEILVEIKSTTHIDPIEVSFLEKIATSFNSKHIFYLSKDMTPQQRGKVRCLHYLEGIKEILLL